MKVLATLSLMACVSTAMASTQYGGVTFDSSVPQDQVSILKNDIRYLYKTPVTKTDSEFVSITGLKSGSGEHMHNWVLNRVRYIIGENFDLQRNMFEVKKLLFKFPNTPLPDEIYADKIEEVKTVMTNIGGALYLGGKMEDILIGLKMDNELVSIKSPRVGILQVGEGLFYEGFQINRKNKMASSNSISRLGTLFHEARHSDGNGKSTGFVHSICPSGHAYAGYAACEFSGNGSYTVGALSERHMLKNCTDCTTEEQTVLSAAIADSFDRIFSKDKARAKAAVESELLSLKKVLVVYKTTNWPDSLKERVEAEIKAIEAKIAELEKKLAGMSIKPDSKPVNLDATPEGSYKELSVSETSKLMQTSLKK